MSLFPDRMQEALMVYRVTFIPGDGVGPELSEATRRVLEATGVGFDWDVQEAGADVMDKYGTPLPDHVLESIRRNGLAIGLAVLGEKLVTWSRPEPHAAIIFS